MSRALTIPHFLVNHVRRMPHTDDGRRDATRTPPPPFISRSFTCTAPASEADCPTSTEEAADCNVTFLTRAYIHLSQPRACQPSRALQSPPTTRVVDSIILDFIVHRRSQIIAREADPAAKTRPNRSRGRPTIECTFIQGATCKGPRCLMRADPSSVNMFNTLVCPITRRIRFPFLPISRACCPPRKCSRTAVQSTSGAPEMVELGRTGRKPESCHPLPEILCAVLCGRLHREPNLPVLLIFLEGTNHMCKSLYALC